MKPLVLLFLFGNFFAFGAVEKACPPNNDGLAVNLPDTEDCALFYKCNWGVPVPLKCPPCLHFNPTLQRCDWPQDAGCKAKNADIAMLLPNEKDCTTFYGCVWGVEELLKCPSGLHFNPKLEACDWPDQAGCIA